MSALAFNPHIIYGLDFSRLTTGNDAGYIQGFLDKEMAIENSVTLIRTPGNFPDFGEYHFTIKSSWHRRRPTSHAMTVDDILETPIESKSDMRANVYNCRG